MLHFFRSALAPLLFVSLLGACSVAPVRPSAPAQADSTRAFHDSISVGGRLTVRYDQQGPQLLNGSFNWDQRRENTNVELLSPLGQIVARIELTPTRATFQRAGEAPQIAADADQLAATALGWPLPVSGLRDWLQGFVRIAPGQRIAVNPATETAVDNDGWRIVYGDWSDAPAAGQLRPRRIDISRQTQYAGYVQIRIVIDNWQPVPDVASQ